MLSAAGREQRDILSALYRAQAVVEFDLEGTILHANDLFLQVMGYTLDEIRGQSHRMFVPPAEVDGPGYRDFWSRLRAGESFSAEYHRIGKGGRNVWIRAVYNPVLDRRGRPYKVVKFASDVTAEKLKALEMAGRMAAIDRTTAVIEFNMDGTIITANENFLATVGYSLAEIQGHHHRMFVTAEEANSREYKEFWERLRRGEFFVATYRRQGKGGREVWIRASYNPILDLDGKPVKVVKHCSDVTQEQLAQREIDRVLRAMAAGDFSRTVATADKTGVLAAICASINDTNATVQAALDDIESAIAALARGDLTHRITETHGGVFTRITENTNRTVQHLETAVRDISRAAHDISNAAAEIAAGSQDLASRTQQQAASLEETASTMEEIATTVRQNASTASEARDRAETARGIAETGAGVVQDAVSAMDRIEASSRKVSDIIGVIDEIAFQTNLLALNAAVEAARAGDAGKGFAVVAKEVRTLAQRSSEAAKDIKTLIKDSDAQIRQGVAHVSNAGETLQRIRGSVAEAADMVREIADASAAQATSVEEVNRSVTGMDEMTQRNSALVEESSASAGSLQEEAETLTGLVDYFKVDGDRPPLGGAPLDGARHGGNGGRPHPPHLNAVARPA